MKPTALLTNDDGFEAAGLRALADALAAGGGLVEPVAADGGAHRAVEHQDALAEQKKQFHDVEETIAMQAAARPISTTGPRVRTRNRSVSPPAQTMTRAERVVPSE